MEHEPPSKTISKDIMDIGSADIPANDIKSKQRMGIWDRFAQPILYPAGSSVCSRCLFIFNYLQEK